MRRIFIVSLLFVFVLNLKAFAQLPQPLKENGRVILSDSFDSPNNNWQPIYLQGKQQDGSFSISEGKLVIDNKQQDSVFGVYNSTPVSGHFYAEVDFGDDNFCGLGLIQLKNGTPDVNNFTSIYVHRNDEGKVVVSLDDCQNGIDDVFDNTGQLGKSRYEHVLTGNKYSVPFDCTNKKFRIFRDDPAGFFHLYYSVGKEINGKWAQDWLELAPSRDWANKGQEYCVVLYARSGKTAPAKATFDNLRIVQKPTTDQNDANTGFKAVFRDYNWSGFWGDALVITFGDDFDYRKNDCKFVFWTQANYIPGWHLNNQLFYTYEFVETWGQGDRKLNPGCYEPMSDRLLRWSNVKVLQDNNVRKIIRWHYVLCNPDYRVVNDWQGSQLPEVDEYWTFYPDGTGIRQIIYAPKLDSDYSNGHELTELIVVAGSLTNPRDHLDSPALTVLNVGDGLFSYHPGASFNEKINTWNQVIMAAHFKNAPDAFNVFSDGEDIPETYSHYKITYELSWHNTGYEFCHWPVGKEPFQLMDKTFRNFKAQVSHSCLMGAGVHSDTKWNDNFELDANGRKYRQWVSLVGLNDPGSNESLRMKTASWLYPGSITMLSDGVQFEKINYARKEFVFNKTNDNKERICNFILDPTLKSTTVLNPVFTINNWGKHPVDIMVNGTKLTEGKFKYAFEDESVIIWVKDRFDSATIFKIESRTKTKLLNGQ